MLDEIVFITKKMGKQSLLYVCLKKIRGRLQRTSGKWGGGVVLKFRTFPDGGRGGGL